MKPFCILFAFVLFIQSATAQEKKISGTVLDPAGVPLAGASITIKGQPKGVISDAEGKFSISVTTGNILTISFMSYESQDVAIGNQNSIQVKLKESGYTSLNEVVVTALGVERKSKSLSYSTEKIDSKELSTVRETNVMNSLSGKVAGLNIVRGSSAPGSSVKIVLRGNKSTTENTPLYVIDGMPVSNLTGAQATDVWGQTNGSGTSASDSGDSLSSLNPDDIESINVLKGASAAALYGSQAANGVIMITTKKGKSGTTTINLSSSYTADQALYIPKMQNDYGSSGSKSWGTKGTGHDPKIKDFFDLGNTFINSLAISSGNQKNQTYFSYSNTMANGIMPTNDLKKHTLGFRESAKLSDKLSLDANILLSTQSINNQPGSGMYNNPLTGLYLFPRSENFSDYSGSNFERYSPIRNMMVQKWHNIDPDGLQTGSIQGGDDNQQNPYWNLYRTPSTRVRDRTFVSLTSKYDFTNDLFLQVRANADRSRSKFEQKYYATTQAVVADVNGRYTLDNTIHTQMYADAILNYKKKINTNFNINTLLGTSITRLWGNDDTFIDSYGTGLRYANIFQLSNINQGAMTITQTINNRELQALFASAQIGYKDYLFLDLTGRNDWASTLPNTSFFYPSVGLTAVVSDMVKLPLDFLKVRASYALVGNDVAPYATNPLNTIDSKLGLQLNTVGPMPGTTLKPEQSKSLEFGLETRFLHNRINVEATYYKNNTINQYILINAPTGSGYSKYAINAGNIQNSGVELVIGAKIITSPDWKWNADLNLSKNVNKIIELHPNLKGEYYLTEPGVNNYALVIKEGGSFGEIYGKKFARDANGNVQYTEIIKNGLGTGEYEPVAVDGLQSVGNSNPDMLAGLRNTFTYKNLALSFLIDGRFGGKMMSFTEAVIAEYGVSAQSAKDRDTGLKTPDGHDIDVQNYYSKVGGRAGITEAFMYDATNIRLRELSLNYTFSKDLIKPLKFVQNASIGFIARNLFFISKKAPFDPEIAMSSGNGLQGVEVFSLPSTRSFGVSLKVGF